MMPPSLPLIRLKPMADARAIRHGFPWVYSNELVLDRRTKTLTPGTVALLQDAERRDLNIVAFNHNSRIAARVLDRDTSASIDEGWFAAKIETALQHRRRLYRSPFYRLIHAEADGLPGVVVDRFADTLVVQPNAAWAEVLLDEISNALLAETGCKNLIKNGTGRTRALEGLPEETRVLHGAIDGPVLVEMNGATYFADVLGGQKTGLFFDQRSNHAFASTLADGARVLDVFSHVGGFALAALASGATSALSIDSSAAALALAEKGAAASGVADRLETRKGDAFKSMESLAAEGERFDLVICDPPAFAPSRTALDKGLRAYERVARLAAGLVAPGGYLGLCSCSHAADLSKFRAACARGIGKAGRRGQIIHTGFVGPDHPQLPQLAESGYLKALFFRLGK